MKKLYKVLAGIITCVVLSMFCAQLSEATVKEISPGLIAVNGEVYGSDFFEFYEATLDESIRHYKIVLHTPGGDGAACIGIISRIKEMKAKGIKFTTEGYGFAASAGSYIFMMGDRRIAHEGLTLMWHTVEAQLIARNQLHRVEKSALLYIRMIDRYIRKVFKAATGMSDKSIGYWLDGGGAQYMSYKTAYAVGIATEIVEN